ncbi:hypothetical protein APASM_2093 [Actinosynnema pretiosum subsp. pretiosum]|nr:hypothetical protein APASM_2093 [Actinosynnema pretiosum subsp. pretiosum]
MFPFQGTCRESQYYPFARLRTRPGRWFSERFSRGGSRGMLIRDPIAEGVWCGCAR